VEIRDVDAEDVFTAYRERPFVAQLGWINWPTRNLQKAVVDYLRAYTQTARWVTEDLIGLDELQRFEDELVDEWQREFEFMQIDLGDTAIEEEKQRAGTERSCGAAPIPQGPAAPHRSARPAPASGS